MGSDHIGLCHEVRGVVGEGGAKRTDREKYFQTICDKAENKNSDSNRINDDDIDNYRRVYGVVLRTVVQKIHDNLKYSELQTCKFYL